MNILEQMLENCKSGSDKTQGKLGRFKFHLLMWLDKNNFSSASKQIDDYKNDLKKEYKGRMQILNEIEQQIEKKGK
ncbi:MAG: hypothetical protein P8N25_00265 [Alphaproteobacteria bacterium]|nr:hypothetical protein [Alphaproteobacteria bacterium]